MIKTIKNKLINMFLENRSKNTAIAYKKDLISFAQFLKINNINDITDTIINFGQNRTNTIIMQYKISLLKKEMSANTINRKLSVIRSLFCLAEQLGIINFNINIKNEKVELCRDTRGPGKDGIIKMLSIVKSESKEDIRNMALIRLLFDLGLRRDEVSKINIEDVENDRIKIIGKGKKEPIYMPLPEKTKTSINKWLKIRGAYKSTDPLFINLCKGRNNRLTGSGIYLIIKTIGNKVGVDVTPHKIRHTSITEALELTNGDLRNVMKFSRHSNMATLQHYDDNRLVPETTIAKKLSEIE